MSEKLPPLFRATFIKGPLISGKERLTFTEIDPFGTCYAIDGEFTTHSKNLENITPLVAIDLAELTSKIEAEYELKYDRTDLDIGRNVGLKDALNIIKELAK